MALRNTRKPRIQLPERKTAPPPKPVEPIKAIKNMDEVLEACRKLTEKYAGQYECVTDVNRLAEYIALANQNKRLAIDTETTGLDVFTDEVVGFSLYTKGLPACYVPLRHLSRFTGKVDTTQPTVEAVVAVLQTLNPDVVLDFANAQFDLLMLLHSLGIDYSKHRIRDALIAARILNTERKAGTNNLKDLHADYCNATRGPRFNELFKPGTFNLCPYKLGYTYAARDAEMTWELMDALDAELEAEPALKSIFYDIEMPLIPVLLKMKERGVLVDQAKRAELSTIYHQKENDAIKRFELLYTPFIPKIRQFQLSHANTKGAKIDLPVRIGSNQQLQVLLYDIMGLPDPEKKRSVDKGGLAALNSEIANAVLEYREAHKLLSTYIDGLEKFIRPDNTVHSSIRQIGADTGRTSCCDPNLQNIPSRNREIRQMYRARPGYALVSCDYSGQEPRLTASLCRDQQMIDTYRAGKDLYSMIAAVAFNTTYEECQEHRPNGDLYLEGKWRRGNAKVIVLGICYGRQIPSIADQLGCTIDEAQNIYNKVTGAFPGLLKAQEDAIEMAHKLGYVTTLWGRRRHLSAMLHDDYEFEYAPGCNPDFDPFNPTASSMSTEVPKAIAQEHLKKLQSIRWWKEKEEYIRRLREEDGIITRDYSRVKADTGRKCLNARIQGSAADESKLAMIAVDNDPRLKELDSHLVLMIHDEVICEVPEKNLSEAVPIIKSLMEHVADELPVPFKADAEVSECWYGKEINYSDEDEIG